jgi:hypothetical protein
MVEAKTVISSAKVQQFNVKSLILTPYCACSSSIIRSSKNILKSTGDSKLPCFIPLVMLNLGLIDDDQRTVAEEDLYHFSR